jgi:hypothetical protein
MNIQAKCLNISQRPGARKAVPVSIVAAEEATQTEHHTESLAGMHFHEARIGINRHPAPI